MIELPIYGNPLREKTGPYRARDWRLVAVLRMLDVVGCIVPKPNQTIPTNRPVRVLIANWGHLGDVVTILPIVRHLKSLPEIETVGILVGSWAESVVLSSDLDVKIHVADHWALNRNGDNWGRRAVRYFRDAKKLIKDVRLAKYDVSICTFSTFPATHALTWAAGIPCRVGFESAGLGTLLTHRFAWEIDDRSVFDRQIGLLRPLLGDATPKRLEACYPGFTPVAIPEEYRCSDEPFLLHVGAGASVKVWSEENWIELAERLRLEGLDVIITSGGGAEAEAANRIAEAALVKCAGGRLTWREFISLIAYSAAVVTHDTVAGHLAACFKKPTVVLGTGLQRTSYWHPNNPRALVLSHLVGCSPCNRSSGCEHMACVRNISVDSVMSSLRQMC